MEDANLSAQSGKQNKRCLVTVKPTHFKEKFQQTLRVLASSYQVSACSMQTTINEVFGAAPSLRPASACNLQAQH